MGILVTLGYTPPKRQRLVRFLLALVGLYTLPASAQTPPTPSSAAPVERDAAMFARDHILEVRLVMTPEDWRAVRLSRPDGGEVTEPLPGDNVYKRHPAELWIDGVRVGRVGVRKKGFFGSVVSTRPSLKIKLDDFVKGQAYGGVDDLTLNNNVQDLSFVNQLLAYDLFSRVGVKVPRANFAHVTVNGEDLGVYTHVEAISDGFLKRAFGTDTGALFEGMTGDFTDDRLSKIVGKSGNYRAERARLERLRDVLAAPGPLSLPAVEALVDLDAFIRLWAAESLIGHWDGYSGNRNNFYLYVNPADNRMYFIPWGTDGQFIDPPGGIAYLNPPKSVKAVGLLTQRLWELPAVQSRYQAVMRELLAGPWNEARMLADAEGWQKQIQPLSVIAPAIRDQASQRMRRFLARRRADVTAELLSGSVPVWPVPPASPQGPDVPVKVTGTFTAPWGAAVPANPLEVGVAQLQIQLDGQPVTITSAGAYALTNTLPNARAGYPGVVLTGISGTRTWRITLLFDPLVFGVGPMQIDQFEARVGVGIIDNGAPQRTRNLGNRGEVRLEQASAVEGGVLRGSFTLNSFLP